MARDWRRYNYLYHLSPTVAGFFVGAFWQPWLRGRTGHSPVTVGNYATWATTPLRPQASAVFAMTGSMFGVYLKNRSREMKGISLSRRHTGCSAITEPAIYGVALRLKKPSCAVRRGRIGGAIAAPSCRVEILHAGIRVLPVFFKEGHMPQFLRLLSISVACLGALIHLAGWLQR